MSSALGRRVLFLALHATGLHVGCVSKDAALGQSSAETGMLDAARDAAVATPAACTSSPVLIAIEAGSPSAPVGEATNGVSSTSNLHDGGLDALDAALRGDNSAQTSMDGSTPDAAIDSGLWDRQICTQACERSLELPCRSETCVDRCLDELLNGCSQPLRAVYVCWGNSDASEYSCNDRNQVMTPASCSEEVAAYLDCKAPDSNAP